jgi:hypothetical protein
MHQTESQASDFFYHQCPLPWLVLVICGWRSGHGHECPFCWAFSWLPQACEWPPPLVDTQLRVVNGAYVHNTDAVWFSSDFCHRLVTLSGLDSK